MVGVGDSSSWIDGIFGKYFKKCMLLFSVCCYSVYTELGVNSGFWHGETEWDDRNSCVQMMVEFRMRKRQIRCQVGNQPEKLGLRRIPCASQLTISNTVDRNSDSVDKNTGMMYVKPSLV